MTVKRNFVEPYIGHIIVVVLAFGAFYTSTGSTQVKLQGSIDAINQKDQEQDKTLAEQDARDRQMQEAIIAMKTILEVHGDQLKEIKADQKEILERLN